MEAAAFNYQRKHGGATQNSWNNYLPGDEDGKQAAEEKGGVELRMLGAIKDQT